jgi:hypothetical protein
MDLAENAADHLHHECHWLDLLLQRQVLRLRALRDHADDKFRGLYIPDAEVDALFAGSGDPADQPIAALGRQITAAEQENERYLNDAPNLPLAQLKTRFGLSHFECRVLLIALGPELDLRYQTLYAYVQNDVMRKAPTVDLTLKLLCATREEQWSARQVFSPTGALFRNALLRLAEEDRDRESPLLARPLKLPKRVVDFLLGHDLIESELKDVAVCVQPRHRIEDLVLPSETRRQLQSAVSLLRNGGVVLLQGRPGSGRRRAAESLCRDLGLRLLVCDFQLVAADPSKFSLLRRECLLSNAGLYLKADETSLAEPEKQKAHSELAREFADQPLPVFIRASWNKDVPLIPAASVSLHFKLEVPEISMRRDLWGQELNGSATTADLENDLSAFAGKFRFTPGQIREVVAEARNCARLREPRDGRLVAADVYAAARTRISPGLQKLAHKCELLFGWDDLVLPDRTLQQLQEVADSVRFRYLVHSEWRFDRKLGKNSGISVLFSGLSGTGKTMAASVLAQDLNLELYKVDLASVVSKYVGETEKNLNRIFDEAEYSSAVLFFDEADALFGKRSEVKDAHDRYANIEVAFLLQRMEQFSGLAILATNISRNIDSAFVRRIQHVVEFPFPDAAHRERIWRAMFPPEAPLDVDVDFPFLARQFELSGGNIRNVVAAAAFFAAENDRPISMEHLVRATAREFQKMGKLPSRAEFRGHFDVIAAMADGGRP